MVINITVVKANRKGISLDKNIWRGTIVPRKGVGCQPTVFDWLSGPFYVSLGG